MLGNRLTGFRYFVKRPIVVEDRRLIPLAFLYPAVTSDVILGPKAVFRNRQYSRAQFLGINIDRSFIASASDSVDGDKDLADAFFIHITQALTEEEVKLKFLEKRRLTVTSHAAIATFTHVNYGDVECLPTLDEQTFYRYARMDLSDLEVRASLISEIVLLIEQSAPSSRQTAYRSALNARGGRPRKNSYVIDLSSYIHNTPLAIDGVLGNYLEEDFKRSFLKSFCTSRVVKEEDFPYKPSENTETSTEPEQATNEPNEEDEYEEPSSADISEISDEQLERESREIEEAIRRGEIRLEDNGTPQSENNFSQIIN